MHSVFLAAALSAAGMPTEPCPTYRDLERFPPPCVVAQAQKDIARHKERMKTMSPLFLHSDEDAWFDEWAALLKAETAWQWLRSAQDSYYSDPDLDRLSQSLENLRDHIGRQAYGRGWMPMP